MSQSYGYQMILDQNFTKHAIEQLYIELQFQVAKGALLQQLDTVFKKQLIAVEARFKAGEDNGLAQMNMQNWVSMHQQLMIKQQNELLSLQKQFTILLADPNLLLPVGPLKFEPILLDTSLSSNHPIKAYWQQKVQAGVQETNLAKSKLLPQVAMGYTNQSFNLRPEDKTRYNSVSVGLNIALFKAGLKNKVKASQVNETVLEMEKNKALFDLNLQIQKAWSNYQQAIDMYQQIQKTMVPNAIKMGQMANLSFKEGQIGYLEWSTAMTQVQQIEMQALEALVLFHQNQSTLNYLLSK
jgi:cobalt-zinc-cadmium resistance protein CzcA